MKNNYTKVLFGCILAILTMCNAQSTYGQRGKVYGLLTDATTKEVLSYATVNIKNTTTGVTVDNYGKYTISLPTGEQVLVFKFFGYRDHEATVNVSDGGETELNVTLELDVKNLSEVVVTGQALGQAAAINRQINANTIVNIVSQDKIRELPDQNAAETVGRLPGISVQRNAGEGQKVVVRGLSPRFNSITVNGERMPSTDATDRSVDLSMMSPDVLGGIEVFKSLTPDKDADAVGGTINFITKKASQDPEAQVSMQYGYNSHQNEWGQIRSSASASKRFMDNKLGLLVGGNYQKANRSQDSYNIGYERGQVIDGVQEYSPNNVSMSQVLEDRFRYGGSLVADYEFSPSSSIVFNSLLQYTDRDRFQYATNFNGSSGSMSYTQESTESLTKFWSNNVSGEHLLSNSWKITWRVSHGNTDVDRPLDHDVRFVDQGGAEAENTPKEIIERAYELNDLRGTKLSRMRNQFSDVSTSNTNAKIDLEIPLNLSGKITGTLKAGAKIRIDDRERDNTDFTIRGMENFDPQDWDFLGDHDYITDLNGDVIISSFLSPLDDNGYNASEFDFGIGPPDTLAGQHINSAAVLDFYNRFGAEYDRDPNADLDDYKSQDKISAGYIMGTFKYQDLVTVVGGLRAENTALKYTGAVGTSGDLNETADIANANDTTRQRSYFELFPQVNIKIQPRKWFDIRLAYTKTINRPDFYSLVPYSQLSQFNKTLKEGNFDLSHTIATNYDVFFSFYNDYGLLTIGGFYKELDGVDFAIQSRITDAKGNGLTLTKPGNAVGTTTVKGIEVDLQENLRFLPNPFDGIVISANATFLESETFYPFLEVLRNPTRVINSERSGPLIGQPDFITNLSFGYERGGFTGRFSVVHQGQVIAGGSTIGAREEADTYDASTTRLDLTFKQKINKNVKLYININNLTNQQEADFLAIQPRNLSRFGTTADFGVQIMFN